MLKQHCTIHVMNSNTRPVFLVHGIFDSAQSMSAIAHKLTASGIETYAISFKPNDGSVELENLAFQLSRYIAKYKGKATEIDIVAFSMGAIVSRLYINSQAELAATDRVQVRKFISISAPNNGTVLARFLSGSGINQLVPDSQFLQRLNDKSQLKNLKKAGCLWLWTRYDLMIIPARSSIVEGVGTSKMIPVATHPLMLTDHRVLNEVTSWITNNCLYIDTPTTY